MAPSPFGRPPFLLYKSRWRTWKEMHQPLQYHLGCPNGSVAFRAAPKLYPTLLNLVVSGARPSDPNATAKAELKSKHPRLAVSFCELEFPMARQTSSVAAPGTCWRGHDTLQELDTFPNWSPARALKGFGEVGISTARFLSPMLCKLNPGLLHAPSSS